MIKILCTVEMLAYAFHVYASIGTVSHWTGMLPFEVACYGTAIVLTMMIATPSIQNTLTCCAPEVQQYDFDPPEEDDQEEEAGELNIFHDPDFVRIMQKNRAACTAA